MDSYFKTEIEAAKAVNQAYIQTGRDPPNSIPVLSPDNNMKFVQKVSFPIAIPIMISRVSLHFRRGLEYRVRQLIFEGYLGVVTGKVKKNKK